MQDHTREELKRHLMFGDVNGVEKLLQSGDITGPNQMIDLLDNGREKTLLMWACYFCQSHHDNSFIRALVVNHNADVNVQGAGGITPVMYAVIDGFVPVLRILVEESRPNLELRDESGRTALHAAVSMMTSVDREDVIMCLLDNHADANAVDEKGWTPLHHAVFDGNCSIARLLLSDDRVNIEAFTELGHTPLHWACIDGNAEMVELLLSNGANPNAVEEHEDGWTPLLYATRSENTACIQLLIAANADLNKGDSLGQTALHHAVSGGKGKVQVIELLLKSKADWSVRDNSNHMPVDMVEAEHRGRVDSLFVDALSGMVREHVVFRSTTSLLKTLEPDVVPRIAGYCDVPMGDEVDKIRLELDRLRSGRRGH